MYMDMGQSWNLLRGETAFCGALACVGHCVEWFTIPKFMNIMVQVHAGDGFVQLVVKYRYYG